jgi:hypothetical protein
MKTILRRKQRGAAAAWTACLLMCVASQGVALGEMAIDTNAVGKVAAMLSARPSAFGVSITNRAAWDALAKNPNFGSVIAGAERLAKRPIPELPDDLFLDFSRTGNRVRCERVLRERMGRVDAFALAECLENQGRFLQPLAEAIDSVCAEKTWAYPAHDRKLDNFYGRTMEMDLRACAIAWDFGMVDYLLGEKLPAATRQALRENVQKRVLQPFRDMVEGKRKEIAWMRVKNNWNAVCLAGVTGAALALTESPEERAWFIVAARSYIPFFLKSFTPDGYCSEGVGYWNYGFGHFLMLGENLRQATGGKIDLLAEPGATQPALFCRRAEIMDGMYPTIADCSPGSRPDPRFQRFIFKRFGLAGTNSTMEEFARPAGELFETAMFSFLPGALPAIKTEGLTADSPLRTWFDAGGVLIGRPAPGAPAKFAVVLKGGHNAENHNHNDVGSYSVVAGKSMVICDPGGEVYTARTFSPRRYESKVLNSFGHDVPVVAGKLQRPGANARAVVETSEFKEGQDTLALNLTAAYDVPELTRLERSFTYQRKAPASLTIRDQVEYEKPNTFETALITWGTMKKISDSELLISDKEDAVRVEIDTGEKPFTVTEEVIEEDVHTASKPRRIGISLNAPVKSAAIVVTVTPAGKK